MLRSIVKKLHRNKFGQNLSKLKSNQSGTVLIEFAFAVPIFMGLGMYGSEVSMMAINNMKVSQTALNLADNASRLGQVDNGTITPIITEQDILTVYKGAELQSKGLKLFKQGRIILSSLESTPGGQQFIRWRRCKGVRNFSSAYSDDSNGDGTTDTSFNGMGSAANRATALPNSAVMFVEIEYEYKALFGEIFVKKRLLKQEAAFNIRDNRNLGAGLLNNLTPASKAATCDKFTDT
jgi:hypothetical protein